MKKIINVFQTIEVVIAVIILIFLMATKIFGIQSAVVQSGSMEPQIHVGSIVFYKDTDISDISKNDIIVFTRGDMLVVHRVNEVKNGYYITKGDANEVVDAKYVYYDEIEGKLVLSIPYVGKISNTMQGKKAWYAAIGLIVFNVILSVFSSKNKSEQ